MPASIKLPSYRKGFRKRCAQPGEVTILSEGGTYITHCTVNANGGTTHCCAVWTRDESSALLDGMDRPYMLRLMAAVILYVLSIGPMEGLLDRDMVSPSAFAYIDALYTPLIVSETFVPSFRRALDWYTDLFDRPENVNGAAAEDWP